MCLVNLDMENHTLPDSYWLRHHEREITEVLLCPRLPHIAWKMKAIVFNKDMKCYVLFESKALRETHRNQRITLLCWLRLDAPGCTLNQIVLRAWFLTVFAIQVIDKKKWDMPIVFFHHQMLLFHLDSDSPSSPASGLTTVISRFGSWRVNVWLTSWAA